MVGKNWGPYRHKIGLEGKNKCITKILSLKCLVSPYFSMILVPLGNWVCNRHFFSGWAFYDDGKKRESWMKRRTHDR